MSPLTSSLPSGIPWQMISLTDLPEKKILRYTLVIQTKHELFNPKFDRQTLISYQIETYQFNGKSNKIIFHKTSCL